MKKGVFHCESGEEKPFFTSKRIVIEIDESDCYFPRRKDLIGEVFYPEEVWDHGEDWYGFLGL